MMIYQFKNESGPPGGVCRQARAAVVEGCLESCQGMTRLSRLSLIPPFTGEALSIFPD